jgi:hypothetical protein
MERAKTSHISVQLKMDIYCRPKDMTNSLGSWKDVVGPFKRLNQYSAQEFPFMVLLKIDLREIFL